MIIMRALKIACSAKLPRLAALLVAVAGLGVAGCDDHAGDPKMQIGANPVLPPLQQYLMPPMRIAKVVGWGNDETPAVVHGPAIPAPPREFRRFPTQRLLRFAWAASNTAATAAARDWRQFAFSGRRRDRHSPRVPTRRRRQGEWRDAVASLNLQS